MHNHVRWSLVAGMLLVGTAGAELAAQGKADARAATPRDGAVQGKAMGASGAAARTAQGSAATVTVVFRTGDREAFERYFTTHNMRAKPLPPGMRKRLAKGKPLPPGIAKQVLPADLIRIAPPVGRDIEYVIVGDAVLATRAGVVIDIMRGVLR